MFMELDAGLVLDAVMYRVVISKAMLTNKSVYVRNSLAKGWY